MPANRARLFAGIAFLVCFLVLLTACGDGSKASRTGTAVGSAGGGLNDVPVFGQMHPAGPEQHVNGITSRSYSVTGLDAEQAIREFARAMAGSTWKRTADVHSVGATAWGAEWTRSGNTLRVSSIAAPTLQQGGTAASQLTLQLYPQGTTPST